MSKVHMSVPERLFYSLQYVFSNKSMSDFPSAFTAEIMDCMFLFYIDAMHASVERLIPMPGIKEWITRAIERNPKIRKEEPRNVVAFLAYAVNEVSTKRAIKYFLEYENRIISPEEITGLCILELNSSLFISAEITTVAGVQKLYLSCEDDLLSEPSVHPVYNWAIRWRARRDAKYDEGKQT